MVKVENRAEIKAAVEKLQVGTWVLLSYADESTLVLSQVGQGGVETLHAQLSPEHCYFFLIRLSCIKDVGGADTGVKDVLVTYLGDKVSKIKKAKRKADQGDIYSVLQPNHAQIDCYCHDKLTESNILAKADPASGSHIIE